MRLNRRVRSKRGWRARRDSNPRPTDSKSPPTNIYPLLFFCITIDIIEYTDYSLCIGFTEYGPFDVQSVTLLSHQNKTDGRLWQST